jgi:two-component system OmpR family sensor kinase
MGELLAEVVEAAQDHPGFDARSLRLTLLENPWPLPPVLGDRGLLGLACYNLVDNALKYTPPGAEVEVRGYESAGRLVIEVADSGPGIPEEDQPHVFDELYRGANARGSPGSGLGLALVNAVVLLHGGTIDLRSRPGMGSVFTLNLPTES